MMTTDVRRFLAGTACPAFVSDASGQILGMNGPCEALLGYDSATVRGRRCREVFVGRDSFNNLFCLKRCAVREMAALSEAVNPFDVRLKAASGAMLDVSISVLAVRDSGCKRPAILHLLKPAEHAGDEKSRREANRPIAGTRHERDDHSSFPNGNGSTSLTPREHEALCLLSAGRSCHDMAREMGISLVTVRNHLKRIFPKLHVHSQAEAVSFAFKNRLI